MVEGCTLSINQKVHVRQYLLTPILMINITNRRIGFYVKFSQAVGLVRTFDDQLGGYFEWFCMIPDGVDDAPREHYMDGGFAYQVNNDLQLDVRVGFGVNDSADDYFAGLGLIYRY